MTLPDFHFTHTDADGDTLEIEEALPDGAPDDSKVYVHGAGTYVPLRRLRKALRQRADALAVAKHGDTFEAAVSDVYGDATVVRVFAGEAGLVDLNSRAGASLTPKAARRLARRLEEAAAVAEAAE